MMKIVADENIPQVVECFAPFGEVITAPGRSMSPQLVADADALLVRSVTPVNAQLLAGSSVRFVGTATIGTDHLDIEWLERQGIAWSNAPGCNANSVVDYVLSAICTVEGLLEKLLAGGSVAIAGLGNVGGRLYQRLTAMGIECHAYDPLLPQDHPIPCHNREVLYAADLVCLHTPLTQTGPFPTRHAWGVEELSRLAAGTTLLNAGRGEVIDNQALKQRLLQGDDFTAVLDVWEHEPSIDLELMQQVALATPHIAGYSYDGKLSGTAMIGEAFSRCFELPSVPQPESREVSPSICLKAGCRAELLRQAVLGCYSVAQDDARMRAELSGSNDPAQGFDQLRKGYPVRREFASCVLQAEAGISKADLNWLGAAGFVHSVV